MKLLNVEWDHLSFESILMVNWWMVFGSFGSKRVEKLIEQLFDKSFNKCCWGLFRFKSWIKFIVKFAEKGTFFYVFKLSVEILRLIDKNLEPNDVYMKQNLNFLTPIPTFDGKGFSCNTENCNRILDNRCPTKSYIMNDPSRHFSITQWIKPTKVCVQISALKKGNLEKL